MNSFVAHLWTPIWQWICLAICYTSDQSIYEQGLKSLDDLIFKPLIHYLMILKAVNHRIFAWRQKSQRSGQQKRKNLEGHVLSKTPQLKGFDSFIGAINIQESSNIAQKQENNFSPRCPIKRAVKPATNIATAMAAYIRWQHATLGKPSTKVLGFSFSLCYFPFFWCFHAFSWNPSVSPVSLIYCCKVNKSCHTCFLWRHAEQISRMVRCICSRCTLSERILVLMLHTSQSGNSLIRL